MFFIPKFVIDILWALVGVSAIVFVSAIVALKIRNRKKRFQLDEDSKQGLRDVFRAKYKEQMLTEATRLQEEKATQRAKQDAHDLVYDKPKMGTGLMTGLKKFNAEMEKGAGGLNTNFLNDVLGIDSQQTRRPARDPNPPKTQTPKSKPRYTTWTDDLEKEFS